MLWLSSGITAQQLLAEKPFATEADITKATTNGQGILYVADNKNQVWSYDSLGQQLAYYSPERLLTIKQLVPKPGRKLVLFDRNNQSLTTLDRFLIERQTQLLQEWLPSYFIEAVAVADDNQWWMIDLNNLRLLKIDAETGQELTSVSLYDVEIDNPLRADAFWMKNNRLWLLSGNELLQFDRLGNYQQTQKLPPARVYQAADGRLYYISENKVGWLDVVSQEVKEVIYPDLTRYSTLTGDLNKLWLFERNKSIPFRILPSK
jgi:hypothetical protein